MPSFEEYEAALKARDTVQALVGAEMERQRPGYRYATVVSISPILNQAQVVFPEGGDPVTVQMTAIQPSFVGQLVRIDGKPGDRFIADVFGTASLAGVPVASDDYMWAPVTYLNSWSDYATGTRPLSYRKSWDGFYVEIEGVCKRVAGAPTYPSSIFQLPAGFTPPFPHYYLGIVVSGMALVGIDATGFVQANAALIGGPTQSFLEINVRFPLRA